MDLRVSVENVDKNDSNWANRGLARVLAAGDHGVEDGPDGDHGVEDGDDGDHGVEDGDDRDHGVEDGDEEDEDDVEDPHLSSN